MSATDPIVAIRAILLADTPTEDLVDSRVYSGEVPPDAVKDMPQACIVLNPAGGLSDSSLLQFGKTRLDTHCYGETLGEAWKVYLAVATALKNTGPGEHVGVLIHAVSVLSKGALGRNPDTQDPLCLASFMVTASETSE